MPLHLDHDHHEERDQHDGAEIEDDHGEPDHGGVLRVEIGYLLSRHLR
jgi:hypothetical protein